MTIAGLVGSVALVLLAPRAWRALSPCLLLAAVGSWGIAEKERNGAGGRGAVLVVLRAAAMLLAAGGAALLILAFFGAALGTWIS